MDNLLIICLMALPIMSVQADYEHSCSALQLESTPQTSVITICGQQLPMMLRTVCRNGIHIRNRRDILLDRQVANTYLRTKRNTVDGEQSITCECCINRCTRTELSQYCRSSLRRRRRSVNAIDDDAANDVMINFTQEMVDDMYKSFENNTDPIPYHRTRHQEKIIHHLEKIKLENIKRKHAPQATASTSSHFITSSIDQHIIDSKYHIHNKRSVAGLIS